MVTERNVVSGPTVDRVLEDASSLLSHQIKRRLPVATTTAFGTIPAKYFKTHPLGRSYYKFLEKVTMGYQNFMEVEMFSFSQALAELRLGKRIARTGWNGKGMYIELQPPFAGNKMTLPYIYMKTACDNFVPWLASQTDILATDWVIV